MSQFLRSLPAAFWGLFWALVLLLSVGTWLAGEAVRVADQDAHVRKSTAAATSLADMIGNVAAAGEVDASRLSAMIQVWRQGDPEIQQVRIVRREAGELLFSTDPADLAAGATPRRLVRAEKDLFDLANALRGHIDSNAAEGVLRLRELEIAAVGSGLLRATAPVVADGSYWGVVQVDRARDGSALEAGLLWGVLLGLVALALMLAVGGAAARVPAGPQVRRWALFLVATMILAGVATLFMRVELAAVGDARTERAEQVRDVLSGLGTATRQVAAIAGVTVGPASSWDTDLFRRPLGQIAPDGAVDEAAVAARAAETTQSLRVQLRITAVLAGLLLAFVALGGARHIADTVREHRTAYTYILPAMAGMLVLVFFPFLYGAMLSFTDRTLVNQSVPLTELWVGFSNYIRILSDVDVFRWTPDGMTINYESFYWTLFITICWTVANVAIGVTVGLSLALVLNTEGLRGRAIYRVLLILPWAIPNYITALTWKGMFHQQFGVINQVIMMFGGEPVAWFDGVFTSFMTGVVTNGWLSFPFMMVISLGALAAIPQDMYEAAKLDGASRWHQFWHITLPLLKPALIPAIILSVVWTFNMFNVIYLVSAGEPGGANEILITKAYKLAFERYQYAYAAAYSMVIFLILLAYGVFQNRATRATESVA